MQTPPVLEVEPPVEMSREDGRIIFAKLNDVYIDERVGYGPGWSDKRVAADLSVPLAWVRKVRVEHFGDEGMSETDRATIEAAAAIRQEISAMAARIEAHARDRSDITIKLAALEKDGQTLRTDIAALKTRLATVDRNVETVRKAVAQR